MRKLRKHRLEIECQTKTILAQLTCASAVDRWEQDKLLWETLTRQGVQVTAEDEAIRAKFIAESIGVLELSQYLSERLGWLP